MDFKNTSPKKSNTGKIIALLLIVIGALFLTGSLKVELNASVEEGSDQEIITPANVMYEYNEKVNTPVYFFTSSWCGNCELIESKIKTLAVGFSDATFMILNIEDYRDLANKYEIFLTPGLVFPKQSNSVIYSQVDVADVEKLLNINLLQVE